MALLRRSKATRSDFFPGFVDVAEIGIGSLATVYRAREIGTERFVALKLLNVRDASPRTLDSFERESIALGAVSSHPNIVTLFRSFRAGDGRPVLVLELCTGSVAERMRNSGGLPVPEVVALGIKIAGALETAHHAGILHRDVKPQNMLITDFGQPALADFGVAMLQSSTQTTAGLFDFTTLHAAPELLEGGETSAATDVYELASSLYQLIAGRSAFRASTGESPASVILRILRDPVQPLLDAQVPTQLSDLLTRAMSKDKDGRPSSAAEFAEELAEIEAAQGWPRTAFLVRDSDMPAASRPAPVPTRKTPRAVSVPLPPPPVPIDEGWSEVSLSRPMPGPRHAIRIDEDPDDELTAVPPAPAPPPTPSVRPAAKPEAPPAVTTRRSALPSVPSAPPPTPAPPAVPTPPATPTPPAPAIEHTRVRPVLPLPVAGETTRRVVPAPEQYPIPPAAFGSAEGTTAVPTWGFRGTSEAAPSASTAAPPAELTLDPMALRRRVTIRAGTSSLTIDESGLVLRAWWRRREIRWPDVLGFEPRLDTMVGSGSAGRITALTARGPVELPATKRSMPDLHYVHALLDAYRQRATIMNRR